MTRQPAVKVFRNETFAEYIQRRADRPYAVSIDRFPRSEVKDIVELTIECVSAHFQCSLTDSLERLGLDRVDILYLHDPERIDLTVAVEEALPALAELRDCGVVSAVEVGSMSTEGLFAAANSGLVDLLMVAGRYTLAKQTILDEVVPSCETTGVQLVLASVFNSGLLASDDVSGATRYDYGEAPGDLLARVIHIRDICRSFGVSLPAAALHCVARNPLVASTVIAGSRPEQIAQNVERMSEPIPEELWDALALAGLIR